MMLIALLLLSLLNLAGLVLVWRFVSTPSAPLVIPPVDVSPILAEIGRIHAALEQSPKETVDLSPLVAEVKRLRAEPVPRVPKVSTPSAPRPPKAAKAAKARPGLSALRARLQRRGVHASRPS